MTDRVKGFTVVLEKDIRIDDVQHVIDAIQMIKGVYMVKPVLAATGSDLVTELRMQGNIKEKLYKFIENDLFKNS